MSKQLLNLTAQFFGIEPESITGQSKKREFVKAREFICATVRKDESLRNTGKIINRDHSSVSVSITKFNEHYQFEKDYKKDFYEYTNFLALNMGQGTQREKLRREFERETGRIYKKNSPHAYCTWIENKLVFDE